MDNALRACVAAHRIQLKQAELREKWKAEEGRWPEPVLKMRTRIGLNTGLTTIGNMGSQTRFNYTMMGDTVNLAARLESAAKQYGVYTMISHYTYDMVKNDFEARQLEKITVVGKSEPVVVYELLAEKGGLPPDLARLIDLYSQGMALFYAREWDKAIAAMTEADHYEPHRAYSKRRRAETSSGFANDIKRSRLRRSGTASTS